MVELKAALNQNWNKIDEGWVEINPGKGINSKLKLIETGENTGLFKAKYKVPEGRLLEISYGYLGFGKKTLVQIQ